MKPNKLYSGESLKNFKESWLLYAAAGWLAVAVGYTIAESKIDADTIGKPVEQFIVNNFRPGISTSGRIPPQAQTETMMPAASAVTMAKENGLTDYIVPGILLLSEACVAGDYYLRVRKSNRLELKGDFLPPERENPEVSYQEVCDWAGIIDKSFPGKY